jgi:uncharacterized protein involved in tolerance to divalent cations
MFRDYLDIAGCNICVNLIESFSKIYVYNDQLKQTQNDTMLVRFGKKTLPEKGISL